MIASVIVCTYVAIRYRYFEEYAALTMSKPNMVMGLITLVLILEATRRVLGWAVPILVMASLGYTLLGGYIPGNWGHGGFSFEYTMWQLYQTTHGYWGVVTSVVTRVILIFILFGPILFATGAGNGFINFANFFGGRFRGGAGQIAVLASTMFGMFSGAAVANVATTGALTIPTMKKAGYKPSFAGAIEASASSGGQIMPPIMGTGAFLMAEFLAIPYLKIVIVAAVPALLFYVCIFAGIFFEASATKIGTLPKHLIPKAREVFMWKNLAPAVIPLSVLVFLLVRFYSPQYCAAWATATSGLLFLLTGGSITWNGIRKRILALGGGVLEGIRALSWLVVMIVCIQVVVCLVAFTGIGVKFASLLIEFSEASLILALLTAMIATIIMGMGMPTVAAYVIAVAVIGPALAKLGLPLLNAHMFIFYFAIISAITPPVAIATYPASALSGASWFSIALTAMRLAIAAYVVPFFFIYNPILLMGGEPVQFIIALVSAVLGVICLSSGTMAYLLKQNTIWETILLLIAGITLLFGGLNNGLIALGMIGAVLLSQRLMPRVFLLR
jgi:TRAP transporter 4TM/12TM fusion protein